MSLVELVIIIVRLIAIDGHIIGVTGTPSLPLLPQFRLSDSL